MFIRTQLATRLRIILAFLFSTGGAAAQNAATVEITGAIVKAGERVEFAVTLDRPTTVNGSFISWSIGGPNQFNISQSAALKTGSRNVVISYLLPDDAPSGEYYLDPMYFMSPSGKRIPLTKGKTFFRVEAKNGIEYPTNAEVVLKPSQVQLFRFEASRLQSEEQELRVRFGSLQNISDPEYKRTLLATLGQARTALQRTENDFKTLINTTNTQREQARTFFADLEFTYLRVQTALDSRASNGKDGVLRPVWFSLGGQHESGLIGQGILGAIDDNRMAYVTVADNGSFLFDLTVKSLPEGATVSYARRGDLFTAASETTNATIPSLTLAIWRVRFHKEGFRDAEREHNAITERDHVIEVNLAPLRR